MPKVHLTERNVTALKLPRKGTKAIRYWDDDDGSVKGLHVLVSHKGTRSYRVIYRFKGSAKEHAMLLGQVDDMTLEQARDKARDVRRAAARGDDPKADEPTSTDSFKSCVETWTKNEQQGRKERVSADKSLKLILTHTKRWHDRPIGTLRYAEIDDRLCEIRDGTAQRKPAKYSANLLHALLSTMFRWAKRTKRITENPMADMPKPWLGAKRRSLAWFEGKKADAAIKAVWRAADQLGGSQGKFVKLTMSLGKRRTAIETMRWEHIDEDWYWQPTCGNKFKRCHAVPMPKLAQRVLAPRGDRGRVLDLIQPKELLLQVRKLTGIPDFIFHGLRHVMETKLAELRVPPHIRDQLLDHAPVRGAGKGYDHHEYSDEMLEALELWCGHIVRLVYGADNIEALR